jgi:hypothetical protein
MLARLIAYPPEQPAIVRQVRPGEVLRIGRAPGSGLRIEHASVSRNQAELASDDDGWRLRDLGSKNGSFADGHRVEPESRLVAACWLRFGDVHVEFSPLSEAELAAEERGRQNRRAVATAHTARIERLTRLGDLLDATLHSVLELAQCRRGFLLLAQGDDFSVGSSLSLDTQRLAAREFCGSVGAVRRTLAQRTPIVVNDVEREGWLSSRASVAQAGIRALVCLPLLEGERVLGAVYADRTDEGAAITTLDLELLQAFTEHAAVWIAARQASEQLERPAPQWAPIVAAHAGAA